jgi:hypothetical protein
MLLTFTTTIKDLNLYYLLDLLVSVTLGVGGLYFAYSLKEHSITNGWFKTLKYILGLLSISAISNVYSLLLLGYNKVQPTELILNISMLVLLGWAVMYYVRNIAGPGTSLTPEKVLKFIETEHS